MKVNFTTKEVSALVISALTLGIVFGFNDEREVFNASLWLSNLLLMVVLSLLSLMVFVFAQKKVGARYGSHIEYSIWKIRRFGLMDSSYLHKTGEMGQRVGSPISAIPLGIVLPILIAFLSEGAVLFAVTGMIALATKSKHRLGKRFTGLTDFETSKVAVAGPIACICFALILSALNTPTPIVSSLITINIALAIANMLPIPLIAGGTAFLSSKFFYIFSFAFILFAAVIMWYVSSIVAFLFALVLAILLVAIAYHFGEIKGNF